MHQQARLPEIFDQILQNTPVLEFGSRTLPPPLKIEIVPRGPSLSLPRTPPPAPKWKTLTFFPEFKSELTQNTPPPLRTLR